MHIGTKYHDTALFFSISMHHNSAKIGILKIQPDKIP